jgi:hypothetical protein
MCTLFFLWENQDILHGSKLQALDYQNILISDVTEMPKKKSSFALKRQRG